MSKKKKATSNKNNEGVFRVPDQQLEMEDFVSRQSCELIRELQFCLKQYEEVVGSVDGTAWHVDDGVGSELRKQIVEAKKAIRLQEKRAARAKKSESKDSSVDTNRLGELVDVQQSELLETE